VTAEFSRTPGWASARTAKIPILDLTAPTLAQLAQAARWIAREKRRGSVYVHCKAGYSRSAAVVGAFLLATGQARSAREAIDRIRRARPSVVVREEAREALQDFESELRTGRTALMEVKEAGGAPRHDLASSSFPGAGVPQEDCFRSSSKG